jgi:hypothetical protein
MKKREKERKRCNEKRRTFILVRKLSAKSVVEKKENILCVFNETHEIYEEHIVTEQPHIQTHV